MKTTHCFLFEAGLVALYAQLFLSVPPFDPLTTKVLVAMSAIANVGGLLTVLGVPAARRGFGGRLMRSLCVGMAVTVVVITARDIFGVPPVPHGSAGGWLLVMIGGYGFVFLYWSTIRVLPGHNRPVWHFPARFGRTG